MQIMSEQLRIRSATKMTDEKLNLTQEWEKVFPKSDKLTTKKRHFTIATASRWRRICTHRRMQWASCPPLPSGSIRCSEGAVLRTVRAEDGGVWLSHHCLRSVLYRRERRTAPVLSFSGAFLLPLFCEPTRFLLVT